MLVESDSHYAISLLEGSSENSNKYFRLVSMIKDLIHNKGVAFLGSIFIGRQIM